MDVTRSSSPNRIWRLLAALLPCIAATLLVQAKHSLAAETGSSFTIVATDSNRKTRPEHSEPTSARGALTFVHPSAVRSSASAQKPKRQTRSTPVSTVQVAQHHEEISRPAPVDPATKLLLEAHALSQQAATEADYTQIVEQCAEAVRSDADKEKTRFAHLLSSWALNRRGQLRADLGQQDLADADFRAALDFNPDNWRAIHNRGVSFAQGGQYAEAFDDFNHVIELNPRFAKAFANRATLYIQANDLQAALEDYRQAALLDPDLAKAQVGLGRVYHLLGQWDQALEHFDAAVRLQPDNAEITCSRADLLADMGQYRKALADYARTIEIDPEFGHAYRNGAWLLATCPDAQFRDAENALLGARQALEIGYGQRHVALDTLAAALANAGQYDEAVSTLQQALDIAPTEAKLAYAYRLQLYGQQQPFRTEPADNISQATYEVSDK